VWMTVARAVKIGQSTDKELRREKKKSKKPEKTAPPAHQSLITFYLERAQALISLGQIRSGSSKGSGVYIFSSPFSEVGLIQIRVQQGRRLCPSVKMILSIGRLLHLHSSHPVSLTTPFASSISISNSNALSIHRLSTASAQAPPPEAKPHFAAVDYLIQSCGLSSVDALRASKYIEHLESNERPDAVLGFLRQIGISESAIRTAVSRDSRLLCSSLEKNWRPTVEKLKEVGFSIGDISAMVARYPSAFCFDVKPKIDFFVQVLGSTENVIMVLKVQTLVLSANLENVLIPNVSFLQDKLGLSIPQIVQLIKLAPFLVTSSPETLAIKTEKAEELGISRSSRMFMYALALVSNLRQQTIDARVNNFKSLGFSQEEVTTLVTNQPFVLRLREEYMARKIKFLFNEVGCDTTYVVGHPSLLTLSLEKRLIPRNLVKKLLELKGLLLNNRQFYYVVALSEKQFREKFLLAHEHAIPGLHQAYIDACAGNIAGIKWLESNLS
jgi:mTERF domain-containing protein, mitochondrial